MIRIRFPHDFIHDTAGTPKGDRFLHRHDPIVVCVPLLEIRAARGIAADPLLQRHTAVMVRIARNKNPDDKKIARFVAGQLSVVIRVGWAEAVGSGGGSSWCRRDSIRRKCKEGDSCEEKEDTSRAGY